jgi:carboxymethylenebutenolidase
MTIIADTFVDLETSRGPMRVHLFIPQGKGRHPAVIFYSEIFQVTGPIRRMASALSGHGYFVVAPEVYHEFEPLGTVLRDEGPRYNPALARDCMGLLLRFFSEKLSI